jgi:hypothetical protein
MEKIVEIDVWSDNWEGQEIINILHDIGMKTAGMHTESTGTFEEGVEWERCKSGEIASICVSLKGDEMKSIAENVHATKDVEEKPLFLFKLTVIDDTPDKEPEDTEEEGEDTMEEEEIKANVTMNIGCTTKWGDVLNTNFMIDEIGYCTDCTITKTIGFYHGQRENSLKVEIYDMGLEGAINLASFFARIFHQECVALTVKDVTVFVKGDCHKEFMDMLEKLEGAVK